MIAPSIWLEAIFYAINESFKTPTFSVLIGSLLGYFITSRTQSTLERKRLFNQLAISFHNEFIDVLLVIADREKTEGLHAVLEENLGKHYKAVVKFRTILCGITHWRFDRAWQDYAGDKNVKFSLRNEPPFPMPSVAHYHDRLEFPQEGTNEREKCRQEIIKKLEKLLDFAKPK